MISDHLGVLSQHFRNAWAMTDRRGERPSQDRNAKQDAKTLSGIECQQSQVPGQDSSLQHNRLLGDFTTCQLSTNIPLSKSYPRNVVRCVALQS